MQGHRVVAASRTRGRRARHKQTLSMKRGSDVPYSTSGHPLAGHAWRNALRSALSSLRDKNLCILRASFLVICSE